MDAGAPITRSLFRRDVHEQQGAARAWNVSLSDSAAGRAHPGAARARRVDDGPIAVADLPGSPARKVGSESLICAAVDVAALRKGWPLSQNGGIDRSARGRTAAPSR